MLFFSLLQISHVYSQSLSTKYITNIDRVVTDYYVRLAYENKYVQKSARNFTIVSKDATGEPVHVKFDYEITEDLKSYVVSGEILYHKGNPYGLITYYNKLTCITPAKFVNGLISNRTDLEIEQIRQLQLKFLANRIKEIQIGMYKEYDYISKYSCLESYYVYETTYEEGVQGFFNSKVIYKNKNLVGEDWKNTCSKHLLIGGFTIDISPNTIHLDNASFFIAPDDFHRKVKISKLTDKNIGDFHSQGFAVYYLL